ncbi:protein of unknown function [Acidithiobacillus ferrivorans]|uniref:Secreted protein n=1 Tax=Acidithiobacillus ferrivorans TaxID=160808 RepID=A0ABY1MMI1_9PROT|nr:protein of unknown function [Acidithiobacillus ferrivorans]
MPATLPTNRATLSTSALASCAASPCASTPYERSSNGFGFLHSIVSCHGRQLYAVRHLFIARAHFPHKLEVVNHSALGGDCIQAPPQFRISRKVCGFRGKLEIPFTLETFLLY